MYILALESSGISGSIAVGNGPSLIEERTLADQQRSARSLIPGIRQLLGDLGIGLQAIGLVATTIGPGSFTGLRIAVATVKTLAYALGVPCIGVNTLRVIAEQACCNANRLSVAMDAQRNEVFWADFSRRRILNGEESATVSHRAISASEPAEDARVSIDRWQMSAGPAIARSQEWLDRLDTSMAVSGPALSRMAGEVPAGVSIVDSSRWSPKAGTVAKLAWQRHLAGAYDDLWKLSPIYLRKSAAEEKLESGNVARK